MKLGCGEWGFRDLPWGSHFEIAKSLGFRTLEFGIGGDFPGRISDAISSQEKSRFQALKENYRISTPFACLENDFTLPDKAAHSSMVARTLIQIRLAQELGATHVRLFAGFTPVAEMTQPIWQRMISALETCAALCGELGVVISLETHGKIAFRDGAAHHQHTVTTDPRWIKALLSEMPPGVGINFDPGNLKAVAPEDSSYCLDLLNPYINYCHLKDWRRMNGGWEAVAIGDSDLDYKKLLPRMTFAGIYLIEYEPTHDVKQGIERSLAYLATLGQKIEFQ